MLEKKTTLDQIEVRDTSVQIRLGLLIVDGDVQVHRDWHRTMVELGGDVDGQMKLVNKHLAIMGYGPVPKKAVTRIKAIAQAAEKN